MNALIHYVLNLTHHILINYKRQSQKVKVSAHNLFSSCAIECIQGISHLEIRTNYCNMSPFKITLNNVTTIFLCFTCPTNKEEKQGDNIFFGITWSS